MAAEWCIIPASNALLLPGPLDIPGNEAIDFLASWFAVHEDKWIHDFRRRLQTTIEKDPERYLPYFAPRPGVTEDFVQYTGQLGKLSTQLTTMAMMAMMDCLEARLLLICQDGQAFEVRSMLPRKRSIVAYAVQTDNHFRMILASNDAPRQNGPRLAKAVRQIKNLKCAF